MISPDMIHVDYTWTRIKSQFLMQGDMIERKGMFLTVDQPPERDDWNFVVHVVGVTDTGDRIPFDVPFNVWIPLGTELPLIF